MPFVSPAEDASLAAEFHETLLPRRRIEQARRLDGKARCPVPSAVAGLEAWEDLGVGEARLSGSSEMTTNQVPQWK